VIRSSVRRAAPSGVSHQPLLVGDPPAQVRDVLLDPRPSLRIGPRQLPFGLVS
jgi:hypothetical protein